MSGDGAVEPVTTGEWESKVLQADRPVAVEFWHDQCGWCKKFEPVLEEVAGERGEELAFYKLHVTQEADITRRYGVQGTPTTKFFCQGREVDELLGFRPKPKLTKKIESVLEEYEECLETSTPLPAGRG